MKKNLLITAAVFVLTTLCKAQTNVYHPFPDSNAVWGMAARCTDFNCGNWMYVKLYYDGDTVINGYNYKKISGQNGPESNSSCCGLPSIPNGFLREDTAARKVYWRDQWIPDTLLYDFTLNVGDTLKGFLNCASVSPDITVISIDSILIGTSYRRRINFDSTNIGSEHFSIIEGIGGTPGLTTPFCLPPVSFGSSLVCFSVNGNIIFPSNPPSSIDTTPCGTLPTGINDYSHYQQKKIVSVFPNPSLEKITLKCQPLYLPLKVSIYDMLGNKYLEKEITLEQVELNISPLPKGVYLLRVENNKTILSFEKIVKQ